MMKSWSELVVLKTLIASKPLTVQERGPAELNFLVTTDTTVNDVPNGNHALTVESHTIQTFAIIRNQKTHI